MRSWVELSAEMRIKCVLERGCVELSGEAEARYVLEMGVWPSYQLRWGFGV